MDRRKFIESAALASAALGLAGTGALAMGKKTSSKKIKFCKQAFEAPMGHWHMLMMGIGSNSQVQWPTALMPMDLEELEKILPAKKVPEFKLGYKDEVWTEVVRYAHDHGVNVILLNLHDGIIFPSHPELALEGSWSVEKVQEQVAWANSLGIEIIPKINFSTRHNGWMKDYQHMVSSKPYYKMVEDVLADIYEIFGHPRFIHVGMDEEDSESLQKKYNYRCQRFGENWWIDFLHVIGTVENLGARPAMWSDYAWGHPDFFERCPKSVIQFNWYYDDNCRGFDPDKIEVPRTRMVLNTFRLLDEAGFDQVPCGSNWVSEYRKNNGLKNEESMKGIVECCSRFVSKEHLLGYLMAPWGGRNMEHQKRAIELLEEALAGTEI